MSRRLRCSLTGTAGGWALAFLAVIGCMRTAVGEEDGGVLSPLADGVGNRALGMGGAYGAVVDDATALVWNPAGLGLVSRAELQVSHAALEVGAQEAFAAFALPSWRWGTVGVSFWHLGVGGIERRDDRNALLGGDLGDREQEIAVGWGRGFGAAFSAGATMKVQNQSLAGYSSAGLGADAGVALKPLVLLRPESAVADQLMLGLAVRNLASPTLRLDRETVRDPGVVRAGLAWRTPWLLLSTDLAKSERTRWRPHAGLEARVHPLVALRTGLDRGWLTAGMGLNWRGMAVDYAFRDAELSLQHRVGVTLAFGPSVSESRAAALRREEERIQARVAQGFQELQTQRVTDLLGRAEEARRARRYHDGLEILAAVATLDPDNAAAAALEVRCLVESAAALEQQGDFATAAATFQHALARAPGDTAALAGERRCLAESDRRARRTQEIRQQFAVAIDAFGAGRLEEARRGFLKVLAASPQDKDAAQMLRRVERGVLARSETLLRQARWEMGTGRLAVASRLIDEARALDPGAAAVADAAAALERARRSSPAPAGRPSDASVTTRPASSPSSLHPQRRRELDALYRRGLEASGKRRSDDAIRYWELVWTADAGFERVAANLKEEYLRRGLDLFSAGQLENALALWEKALVIDSSDERARGYVERARRQLARRNELLGGGQ